MLQFNYDCIDKYIDRKDFQYMYMDTDSSYMALSDDFDKLIKPELREEFEKEKSIGFPVQIPLKTKHLTNVNQAYLKQNMVEMAWQHYVVKHYYCLGSKDKFSCKGTQQSRNMNILNFETYKNCLFNSETVPAINSGLDLMTKK